MAPFLNKKALLDLEDRTLIFESLSHMCGEIHKRRVLAVAGHKRHPVTLPTAFAFFGGGPLFHSNVNTNTRN